MLDRTWPAIELVRTARRPCDLPTVPRAAGPPRRGIPFNQATMSATIMPNEGP
jgi:hypothetical protein